MLDFTLKIKLIEYQYFHIKPRFLIYNQKDNYVLN